MNSIIDLETVVLMRAILRGAITEPGRVARIKEMALDELEFAEMDAKHRGELEALCRQAGMF